MSCSRTGQMTGLDLEHHVCAWKRPHNTRYAFSGEAHVSLTGLSELSRAYTCRRRHLLKRSLVLETAAASVDEVSVGPNSRTFTDVSSKHCLDTARSGETHGRYVPPDVQTVLLVSVTLVADVFSESYSSQPESSVHQWHQPTSIVLTRSVSQPKRDSLEWSTRRNAWC